jgi:MFS family permease
MLHSLFQLQIKAFDYLDSHWEGPTVSKVISNIVLGFFLIGLLLGLLNYLGFWVYSALFSPFFSIELAFNVLLIFEVLGLIFLIPKSVADSVGKQFEIISLVLLRDAFKEFGHYLESVNWEVEFVMELLPIISDAFGAILIFFITGIFYKNQKHLRITQSHEEQRGFIGIKKLLSIYLTISFFGLGVYDIISSYQTHQFIYSIKLFYTLLIFTDVFILLFSLRYTTKYFNLFRYSSFALATIFLRLTLSAPAYYNVGLAVIAGLMVLGVTAIYNMLLNKVPELEKVEKISS